jgi:hypothetical protein
VAAKAKISPAQTYVLDEDVMDEMENLEATHVLPDLDQPDDAGAAEPPFLDDIEVATDILEIEELPIETPDLTDRLADHDGVTTTMKVLQAKAILDEATQETMTMRRRQLKQHRGNWLRRLFGWFKRA